MNIFIHEDYKAEERRKIRKRRLIGVALFAVALVMSLASFTPETALLSFLSWPDTYYRVSHMVVGERC